MLNLLILAAAAATPQSAVPAVVGGLQGCWKAPGKVLGKDAASMARGEWHLGGRYFVLHLRSVAQKEHYEAALVYGAGENPQSISSYWMDTFGGRYSASGAGTTTSNGFDVEYRYPESVYTNRFERAGEGWHWTIMAQDQGKPAKLFAEYRLTPSTCRGMKFGF